MQLIRFSHVIDFFPETQLLSGSRLKQTFTDSGDFGETAG